MKNMSQEDNSNTEQSSATEVANSVGPEVGPFRLTVQWAENTQASDDEKAAVAQLMADLTNEINDPRSKVIAEVVKTITIQRI